MKGSKISIGGESRDQVMRVKIESYNKSAFWMFVVSIVSLVLFISFNILGWELLVYTKT